MEDRELYTALLGLKYPWRVKEVKLNLAADRVDVWVEEAKEAKWFCPECKKSVPIYDHAEERVWRHLDTCHCQTYLHARLPRTKCSEHGVRKVVAPWAEPGSRFTLRFESKLIDTLKECDVTGVGRLMDSSWDEVWRVMEKAVQSGLSRKEQRIPEYLSIDEKAFAKRHRYETLVCDLKKATVEYVIEDREQASLESYYGQFNDKEREKVKAVAMDMWDPYIAATRAYIPQAEDKIVFDRFHVTRQVTEAVDKVRRHEHKALMAQGDETLKKTKYLWLANKENIPEWRKEEFVAIKGMNLKTGRAWAIKESLRKFWTYHYPKNALTYFKRWYFWATHSRLDPMIKAAKTLERHLANIVTYFKHRITNATAEGLNSKI
ncbi:MAG: ISL3 family transposase [Pseudomonadota bacterium]